ncbi:MAG: aldo/keto reductase [Spirochaetales bacterium]|nr:MAG: aldo/keto reductase [Spirochaetales bacterium]
MKTKQLGRSGLKVSEICLGTMTFSREADEAMSFAIADYYVEQGGFFVDTANAYSGGASEATVGRWMKARGNRNDLVVATKVFGAMGDGPNDGGLSRIHIIREVENSLRRLQTEVIDLYQIHRWYRFAPLEETARALEDVIRAGKVRYIGASNLRAFELLSYLHQCDQALLTKFISLQPVYNVLNRGIELEVLPLCEREGLGTIPYNPLAAGMLTGKYRKGKELPKGARLEAQEFYHSRYVTEQAMDVVEAFVLHAATVGLSPAQLALAWVRADSRVTSPIVGARNVEQLTDTLGAMDRELSEDERAAVPAMPSGRWVGVDPVYDRG